MVMEMCFKSSHTVNSNRGKESVDDDDDGDDANAQGRGEAVNKITV